MTAPWIAEVPVPPELAEELIAAQFPDLAGRTVAAFSSGWDNTGFLVDGRWVFRFPRRQVAVPLLIQEMCCLPALAPRLPLAVPVPCLLGIPSERYPFPFAGYALIAGTTACRARLEPAARLALAEPLAGFLRALHDLPLSTLADVGVVADQLRRLDVGRRSPPALALLEHMVARQDATRAQAGALAAIIADAGRARPPRSDTLVHGDLYVRHLMVDGLGALQGVIDWGDLHRGDPAVDLMVAFLVLPPPARARFFARYGAIDADTERLARFRAVLHLGHLLGFAHDSGDVDLVREMRVELGHLLAPP